MSYAYVISNKTCPELFLYLVTFLNSIAMSKINRCGEISLWWYILQYILNSVSFPKACKDMVIVFCCFEFPLKSHPNVQNFVFIFQYNATLILLTRPIKYLPDSIYNFFSKMKVCAKCRGMIYKKSKFVAFLQCGIITSLYVLCSSLKPFWL